MYFATFSHLFNLTLSKMWKIDGKRCFPIFLKMKTKIKITSWDLASLYNTIKFFNLFSFFYLVLITVKTGCGWISLEIKKIKNISINSTWKKYNNWFCSKFFLSFWKHLSQFHAIPTKSNKKINSECTNTFPNQY